MDAGSKKPGAEPHGEARHFIGAGPVGTGPVSFDGEETGVFIHGQAARGLFPALRTLTSRVKGRGQGDDPDLTQSVTVVETLAKVMERGVSVRPPASASVAVREIRYRVAGAESCWELEHRAVGARLWERVAYFKDRIWPDLLADVGNKSPDGSLFDLCLEYLRKNGKALSVQPQQPQESLTL